MEKDPYEGSLDGIHWYKIDPLAVGYHLRKYGHARKRNGNEIYVFNMKKEFKPGDFCRFPNEQIPRIIDILKANGHEVWAQNDVTKATKHDYIVMNSDNFVSNPGNPIESSLYDLTELSQHDFLVIALRLEEGMGMRSDTSTPDQRSHISSEMEKVGIKIGMSVKLYSAERNSIIFLKDELAVCSNKVPVDISYTELCRRLCVEPIEKTLEQHVDEYDANCSNNLSSSFDQTKPMQAFTPGAMWFDVKPENFVGFHKGYPVFWNESLHSYESYLDVRNVPEFNASMLEVGEWMETEEGKDGKRNLIKRLSSEMFVDTRCGHGVFYTDIAKSIKGRKVQVEIKVTWI